jgi:hypothetical protein
MAVKTQQHTPRTFDAKQQEAHKGFYRPNTVAHELVDKSPSQNPPKSLYGSDLKDTCVNIEIEVCASMKRKLIGSEHLLTLIQTDEFKIFDSSVRLKYFVINLQLSKHKNWQEIFLM